MSYSFHIRAASVAAALAAVSAELDKVVEAQPIHEADRAAAEQTVATFLALVGEPTESHDLSVNVNGSVSKWLPVGGTTTEQVTAAGVGVSVSFAALSG